MFIVSLSLFTRDLQPCLIPHGCHQGSLRARPVSAQRPGGRRPQHFAHVAPWSSPWPVSMTSHCHLIKGSYMFMDLLKDPPENERYSLLDSPSSGFPIYRKNHLQQIQILIGGQKSVNIVVPESATIPVFWFRQACWCNCFSLSKGI